MSHGEIPANGLLGAASTGQVYEDVHSGDSTSLNPQQSRPRAEDFPEQPDFSTSSGVANPNRQSLRKSTKLSSGMQPLNGAALESIHDDATVSEDAISPASASSAPRPSLRSSAKVPAIVVPTPTAAAAAATTTAHVPTPAASLSAAAAASVSLLSRSTTLPLPSPLPTSSPVTASPSQSRPLSGGTQPYANSLSNSSFGMNTPLSSSALLPSSSGAGAGAGAAADLSGLMNVQVTYNHNKLNAILGDILSRLQSQELVSGSASSRLGSLAQEVRSEISTVKEDTTGMRNRILALQQDMSMIRSKINSAPTPTAQSATPPESSSSSANDDLTVSPQRRGDGSRRRGGRRHGDRTDYEDTQYNNNDEGEEEEEESGEDYRRRQREREVEERAHDMAATLAQMMTRLAAVEEVAHANAASRDRALAKIAAAEETAVAAHAAANWARDAAERAITERNNMRNRLDAMEQIVSAALAAKNNEDNKQQTSASAAAAAAATELLQREHERERARDRHQIEVLGQELQAVTERLVRLEGLYVGEEERFARVQEEMAELSRERHVTSQKLSSLLRDSDSLKEDVDTVRQDLSGLRKAVDGIQDSATSTIADRETDNAKLQEQLDRTIAGLNALQLRVYQISATAEGSAQTQAAAALALAQAQAASARTQRVSSNDVSAATGLPDARHALKTMSERIDDIHQEVASLRKYACGVEERNNRSLVQQQRQQADALAAALSRVDASSRKARATLARQLADFERDVLYLLDARSQMMGADGNQTTAVGKVQYRCLTCDQPSTRMPGPESVAFHQQHHHGPHGLASAAALLSARGPSAVSSGAGAGVGAGPSGLGSAGSMGMGMTGIPSSVSMTMQSHAHAQALASAERGADPGAAYEQAQRAIKGLAAAGAAYHTAEHSLRGAAALQRALDARATSADGSAGFVGVGGDGSSLNGMGDVNEYDNAPTSSSSSTSAAVGSGSEEWNSTGADARVASSYNEPPPPTAGGSNVASRSMMVVERGQELAVYGKDGQVYRGRGNTRVLFAPPSRAQDRRFQLAYLDRDSGANAGRRAVTPLTTAHAALPGSLGVGLSLGIGGANVAVAAPGSVVDSNNVQAARAAGAGVMVTLANVKGAQNIVGTVPTGTLESVASAAMSSSLPSAAGSSASTTTTTTTSSSSSSSSAPPATSSSAAGFSAGPSSSSSSSSSTFAGGVNGKSTSVAALRGASHTSAVNHNVSHSGSNVSNGPGFSSLARKRTSASSSRGVHAGVTVTATAAATGPGLPSAF